MVIPHEGPLIERLESRGAEVRVQSFPVLRRSALRPAGLVRLVADLVRRGPGILRTVRSSDAGAVYVNTITIPWWLVAARLARKRTLCHVHEAEETGPRLALRMLGMPTALAHRVIANSAASARALSLSAPRAAAKTIVVHNGVPGPPSPPERPGRRQEDRFVVALVGRLSERKGTDVALEAIAILRGEGRNVALALCGTAFEGYEWFERQLRERAELPDLAGAVDFRGYVNPTWPTLADSDAVLVPSRVEPFGNTAVEAMLAERPVIASRTQGLAEIVEDGRTGLQVTPGDAQELAAALRTLADDPERARQIAADGRADAERRFSVDAYARTIHRVVTDQD
ncbi:glycosyltransferase family 4 protein [Aeromicrobium sp. zg-Y1362]|nr:glycosyltransferase family 4 protein [Aeromicrobium duanguangcaii]